MTEDFAVSGSSLNFVSQGISKVNTTFKNEDKVLAVYKNDVRSSSVKLLNNLWPEALHRNE
jgi:hypothetical protein